MTFGSRWRVLAASQTDRFEKESPVEAGLILDELVVDDWLHFEQMDTNEWWARIGDAWVYIELPVDGGPPIVTVKRGFYGPACGPTES
jgi:hypothetical protein